MASKSALWRQKQKEENPEKYADFLKQEKERSKRRRDEKKQQWEHEPHTRAAIQKHDHEKDLARLRQSRFYERKKCATSTRPNTRRSLSSLHGHPKKRPKDMTPDEYRDHRRLLRATSRAQESAQKKRRAREKNTSARRLKRQEQRPQLLHTATPSPVPGPVPLKKSD